MNMFKIFGIYIMTEKRYRKDTDGSFYWGSIYGGTNDKTIQQEAVNEIHKLWGY